MSFTYVPVTGSWSNSKDEVASGSVTFLPTVAMDNDETVSQSPVVVPLVDGAISVTLAANDDPGTIPTGSAYHVIEVINSVVRKYVIVVSHLATEVDLPTAEKGQVAPLVEYPAVWS